MPEKSWTFLSNHGHILIFLSLNPEATLREIAENIGITERRAQGIVSDLEDSGYLKVKKVGRGKAYSIKRSEKFRHPLEAGHSIGELLDIFGVSER